MDPKRCRRLSFANTVEAKSILSQQELWQSAQTAIQTNPKYNGLVLQPQLGLLPLRADPTSGL